MDARLRKHSQPEVQRGLAEFTVGLGPDLIVGCHADVVVETSWDRLGEVMTEGSSLALGGEPRDIGGHARDRYVYAPCDGVFRTKARLDEHRHEAETLQAAGISARVLDENGARELEPALRPDIAGAVYFPEDAHLTPDRFVRGLARLAQERGVTVMPSTEVLGFERSGRRIAAIETTRGAVRASEVVLAAGSWSPALGRQLGVRLPIQPAKGYSVTCDTPPGGPRLPMLLGEARFAVTPMGDALRFGGTLELAGLDLTINRVRVDAIQRGWRDYLAVPGELRLRQIWRGLRPCTPDGLPLLGRPRALDNLVVATGHAMIGVSLGPITGKLVTEIVAGEKPGVDIAALDPDRFG